MTPNPDTGRDTSTEPPDIPRSGLRRFHHRAYPTANQEVTRQFMEELLGIPLVATWTESVRNAPGSRSDASRVLPDGMEFCHTFYELDDGSAIAYFQLAEPHHERFLIDLTNTFDHIALETDEQRQDAIHERLLAANVAHYITDHGYVRSLYVYSPDALSFEICVDPADVEEIKGKRRLDARAELDRWLAGDHSDNNYWKSRSAPRVSFPGRVLYQERASSGG